MKATEELVVMYESPEAAQQKTVTGWVSRLGHFWGKDEHMARYDGCTHKLCDCGNVVTRMYARCDACMGKARAEVYFKMPHRDWDGKTPLVLFDDDRYFFHEEDIEIYCDDNGLKPEDLRLVICVGEGLPEVNPDYWSDNLPEDGELPDNVQKALDALNAEIAKAGTVAWFQGKFRTTVKL